MIRNNAKWHKSYSLKYNNMKLEAAKSPDVERTISDSISVDYEHTKKHTVS
jgi:hypothetical protein